MTGRHAAELRALHETLQARSPASHSLVTAEAGGPETVAQADSELIAVLRELKDGLVAALDSADEVVVTHPVLSVSAAFVLGLAVGRLMKGL